MIIGRDIVVIGIQPWDIEIGSNCKNIAEEMAKYNRVLYVNPPIHRLSAIKEKNDPKIAKRLSVIHGKTESLKQLAPNIWEYNPPIIIEPINRIKFNGLFDFLNKINSRRFAKSVNEAIKKLHFANYILFNDSSMFLGYYLDEYMNYDKYIYYIRDNLIKSKNPYWNTQGERIEKGLIKKVDLVVNNSLYYTNYALQYTKHSYMVGQGCDTRLFNDEKRKISVSPEIEKIPKPIIGYVGFITTKRLSFDILRTIANKLPDWSVVLVGPEDEFFQKSDLHQIKNIHFLGSRDSNILPEFIKGFDVCINPQIVNNATIGNYPRKIDEYLAMGKPVIATKTVAMEYFADYTYLAENDDDYVKYAKQALMENSIEKQARRREFANSHSWEKNLSEIWNALESATEK
jgi:glycosyltransferase involved in cell wall biosynthesis